MKAELLIREWIAYPDGGVAKMVVWRVPKPVPPVAHGFKYRLVYVVGGERVLGFDNERGKGDHRHIGAAEEPYGFTSVDQLLADFVAAVEELRSRT